MSNYNSNLKSWGATGTEYPSGYKYTAGEQPVDEWDNFLISRIITDMNHLVTLTNGRLETGSSSSHPSSPEPGEVSHRTDGVVTTEEEVFFYDSSSGSWHRFMKADGDVMTGLLDMGGYNAENVGSIFTGKDNFGVHTSGTGTGFFSVVDDFNNSNLVKAPEGGHVSLNEAAMATDWLSKQEGGTVSMDNFVPVGTFGLENGEKLLVTQSMLTKDGFTTPCVNGVDLVIADENDEADPANATPTVILSGDGTTHHDDVTGSPLAQYENTSGAHITVAIGIDNGHFNAGYGDTTSAFGGYIARKV